MSRRHAVLAGACGVLMGLVTSACGVSLPEEGPVVETTGAGARPADELGIINPRRPNAGDSPEEVVRGFLDAMTATPAIRTSVAREFLTAAIQEEWQPTGVVVYGTTLISTPRGGDEVELTFIDAERIDERGAWIGPLPPEQATLDIPVELEDGEWRVAAPPDFLMVPRSWFESRFQQVSLYFFDASGTVLVPEPVFVPRGKQLASTLVNALLLGPAPELSGTELTFLPSDLRSVVSVPVSPAGVAQVELTNDGTDVLLAPPEAELLVSQLAWTLRQDPSIRRFRVTIADRPVVLPNGETEFGVGHGSAYAPSVAGASTSLFGLQEGQLAAGSPQSLEPVSGPFGTEDYQLRTFAVDLVAERAAGVASDGSTLWLGPVGAVGDTGGLPTALVTGGVDLLDPAWDHRGRLWTVDRRPEGAVVHYVLDGRLRTLEVMGISGEDVKDFLVSRDGTRLVAVVRRDAGSDAVVLSRILTTGDGKAAAALAAEDVTPPLAVDAKVRELAWLSPTAVMLLQPVSRSLFQIRSASLDGASVGVDSLSVTVAEDVVGLVGTPTPDEPRYAATREFLVDLAGPRGPGTPVEVGVTDLSYVG